MRGWLNGRPDHERQVNRRFFLLAALAQHKTVNGWCQKTWRRSRLSQSK
jgi:hypothetical protein